MSDKTTPTRRQIQDWLSEGEALFGSDRDTWRFKCASCGHETSAAEAMERDPKLGDGRAPEWLRNYLRANCEGRLGGPGCDWSLSGLFQIHQVEVIVDGEAYPVFEFGASNTADLEPTP